MIGVVIFVALVGACSAMKGCQPGSNTVDTTIVSTQPVTLNFRRKADGSDPMECTSIFQSDSDKNLSWKLGKLDNVRVPLMYNCHKKYFLEVKTYDDLTDLTKPVGVSNYCGNAKYGFTSVSTSWGKGGKYIVVDFKGDGSEDRMFDIEVFQKS